MHGIINENLEIIDSSSVSMAKVLEERDLIPNIKQFVDQQK